MSCMVGAPKLDCIFFQVSMDFGSCLGWKSDASLWQGLKGTSSVCQGLACLSIGFDLLGKQSAYVYFCPPNRFRSRQHCSPEKRIDFRFYTLLRGFFYIQMQHIIFGISMEKSILFLRTSHWGINSIQIMYSIFPQLFNFYWLIISLPCNQKFHSGFHECCFLLLGFFSFLWVYL